MSSNWQNLGWPQVRTGITTASHMLQVGEQVTTTLWRGFGITLVWYWYYFESNGITGLVLLVWYYFESSARLKIWVPSTPHLHPLGTSPEETWACTLGEVSTTLVVMLFNSRKLETNLMSIERRSNLWYSHTEEYFTPVERKDLQMHKKKNNVEWTEQISEDSI